MTRRPARLVDVVRLAGMKRVGRKSGTTNEEVEDDVLTEIRELRSRVRAVSGSLVASTDGLLLAHDTHGVEPNGIAALAATSLGLCQRFADAAGHGGFEETLIRGKDGYVATYAAGPTAVLTVLAEVDANIGRLHLEARQTAIRIAGRLGDDLGPGGR